MKAIVRLGLIEFVFLLLGMFAISIVLVFMDTTVFWRDLGAPPGNALRIVEADNESVLVQTDTSGRYYCRFRYGSECWVQKGQPKFRYTDDKDTLFRNYRTPPALSGVVVTQKLYTQISEYSKVLSVYAITQDGSVHVWQDGYGSPYDLFPAVIIVVPVAVVLGLFTWGVLELGGLLRLRKNRREGNSSG
jgi:hypothetical protein